jgi:hypothetical protein
MEIKDAENNGGDDAEKLTITIYDTPMNERLADAEAWVDHYRESRRRTAARIRGLREDLRCAVDRGDELSAHIRVMEKEDRT